MADKFMDKVKNMMGFETDQKYEEDYDDEETEGYEDYNYVGNQSTSQALYGSAQNKVVNISKPSAAGAAPMSQMPSGLPRGNYDMEVVLYQPKEFEDSKTIVDSLKNKKPVILNIEDLDNELGKKIFDFCSGALYALDGHIQKISRGIFILAPYNVEIGGDVRTALESKGIFAWTSRRE